LQANGVAGVRSAGAWRAMVLTTSSLSAEDGALLALARALLEEDTTHALHLATALGGR